MEACYRTWQRFWYTHLRFDRNKRPSESMTDVSTKRVCQHGLLILMFTLAICRLSPLQTYERVQDCPMGMQDALLSPEAS